MKMTKSQRAKTLQFVVSSLADESWPKIDLALLLFGFQTSESWPSGDKESYVVSMLAGVSDDDLLEFAAHFGFKLDGAAAAAAAAHSTPYWAAGNLKAFITHLSPQKAKAGALRAALEPLGISGFVAHTDIHPTKEWQLEIETALATCDVLIALIHPGFIESAWCDQEIGYALGRGVPVFTVKIGADPHGFVSRFQAFVGKGKTPEQIAEELFAAALSHKLLQHTLANAVVSQFEKSSSYADAKAKVALVERLTVWSPTFSQRLEEAASQNGQISGSFGVPSRVARLVKKWA